MPKVYCPKRAKLVKLLGEGDLTTKLSIQLHGVSESAKQKIEAVGGYRKGPCQARARRRPDRVDLGECHEATVIPGPTSRGLGRCSFVASDHGSARLSGRSTHGRWARPAGSSRPEGRRQRALRWPV